MMKALIIRKIRNAQAKGAALLLVAIAVAILAIMGTGLMTLSYGVRSQAIRTKNEAKALLAAEAAYERAVFWMSKQVDLLNVLKTNPGGLANPDPMPKFGESSSDYTIKLYKYFNSRPVYLVQASGHVGQVNRKIESFLFQAIGGWDGTHRVPSSPTASVQWPFATGEVLDIPIHVNKANDSPDVRDVNIIGSPRFLQRVEFGETKGDKYSSSIVKLFEAGVTFNQPDNKISNKFAIKSRVDRFRQTIQDNGNPAAFILTPVKSTDVPGDTQAAVQLEFYLDAGVGKVKVTNDCTVRVYQGSGGSNATYDYKIDPVGSGSTYVKYPIYGYHYVKNDNPGVIYNVTDTYVKQIIAGHESLPGGQIYVNGNVVIGGQLYNQMVVNGKITVLATGNIWIGDDIIVDGPRDGAGKPASDNPNVLGLIALGVIKVVDPGMASYSYVTANGTNGPVAVAGYSYVPIGRHSGGADFNRFLPNPMTIEAAMTVTGGGWGAENVGNRKTVSSSYDQLVVRGMIAEVTRGIVGTAQPLWSSWTRNGYMKSYYWDERLMQGVLPGYIWLQSKFVSTPAGWYEYRI